MSQLPAFYFSSKKEKPQTNLKLNIKSVNNEPVIDFNSMFNLDFVIDNKNYVMDVNFIFKFETNSEPNVDIQYNIKDVPSNKKENLLSFMNNIKTNIKDSVNNETKKLEELEKNNNIKTKKLKELLKLEESIKIQEQNKLTKVKEILKIEEDAKIQTFNDKVRLENIRIEHENKVKELLKVEEDIKIKNSSTLYDSIEDNSHIELMESLKTKNAKIEETNKALEAEELLHIKDPVINFDQTKIISYLKDELDNITADEEKIENLSIEGNNDINQITYLKEKYQTPPLLKSVTPPKNISILDKDVENALKIQDEIVEHLKLIISDNPEMLTTNLIYVITELMKFVETFNMEGFDKKEFIIASIKKFLVYSNLDTEEFNFILDKICPELIEILLLVDKRKIIIRKKLNCFIPWCS